MASEQPTHRGLLVDWGGFLDHRWQGAVKGLTPVLGAAKGAPRTPRVWRPAPRATGGAQSRVPRP
jgi:hypothetical protein